MSITKSQLTVDKTEPSSGDCQRQVAVPLEMIKDAFYFTETHPRQQLVNHIAFEMLQRITELEKTIVKLNAKIDELSQK